MKRKVLSVILSTAMMTALITGCGSTQTGTTINEAQELTEEFTKETGNQPLAGVCWYNFADTIISNARQSLINVSNTDGAVAIVDADSQNDTANQTNNMNNMFSKDVDYLVVNNINTGAIDEICNQILEQGCYGIFANTDSPSDTNFEKNEKLYSVSSVATQSGVIMGEAIAEYWY